MPAAVILFRYILFISFYVISIFDVVGAFIWLARLPDASVAFVLAKMWFATQIYVEISGKFPRTNEVYCNVSYFPNTKFSSELQLRLM